ncbi:sigma-70 family RNA polymerase sigma factor [Mucilaginibacter sp.]|uniref:RNA polymerase sigma factor n=1 Tax=Mucilaginibacter sp. TaxID=1882438 RepID=UPI00284366FA|nr:sigma-70 family RNA polymerase sigma factor [Mucilaginibacter sp.]MDR3696150.1 sigma-70 family RNA polymerase sigma factor [Mucilaginibacter sp.]
MTKKQTQKLVKACVQNDRGAQEALYKLYYADMMQVCQSYLADEELAREAFNTAFLTVFESIKNFDTERGELGGWIRRIMVYSSIDLYRAELKFGNVTDDLPEQETEFIPPAVLEKLYFEDILRHIRTLPSATQTVFILSVLDGFSHKEISEQLNISEGTSRWHLSEAKKQLRGLLENKPGAARPMERGGRK